MSRSPAVMAQMAIGPAGSGTVHIGTYGGGVLTSRDGGRSFRFANNGLTDLAIGAMAAHPGDINHVYVGTFGGQTYRTSDGGANWTALTRTPSPILAMAIDPLRPSTIYTGSFGPPHLRKSIDGGATWSDANAGLPNAGVWTIQIDRGDPDVVYAGTGGGGAFKSVDGGASWSALSVAPTVYAMAIDPRDSRTVYAATDGGGVHRSVDGGRTFAPVGSPANGHVLSLALDPSRRGVVYAGTLGGGVAVSVDFAQTFTETTLASGSALALTSSHNGDVYVGTSFAGVLKSGSYGAVWSRIAADRFDEITAQNIYGLSVDPGDPARVLAATVQAGMLATPDGARTWRESSVGLTVRSPRRPVFDPSDHSRVYTGSLPGGGLFSSNDGGRTWTGRDFGSSSVYVLTVAVGPDRAVYAGTVGEGLWRSTDLGDSFSRLATPFSDVRGLAIDPTDPRRVLCGGSQGLYRSYDGGVTWSQSLTTFTNNIVYHPRNPTIVFATTQASGVLLSDDGGTTFSPLNAGLTTLRTSRAAGVVFDPRDSQTLYVGTEGGGVFKSRDGGASWFPVSSGLTNRTVYALDIDPRNPDVLYAGGSSGVFKTTTGGEVATGHGRTTMRMGGDQR